MTQTFNPKSLEPKIAIFKDSNHTVLAWELQRWVGTEL